MTVSDLSGTGPERCMTPAFSAAGQIGPRGNAHVAGRAGPASTKEQTQPPFCLDTPIAVDIIRPNSSAVLRARD